MSTRRKRKRHFRPFVIDSPASRGKPPKNGPSSPPKSLRERRVVGWKGVRRGARSTLHLQSASRRTVFDMHRAVSHEYQRTDGRGWLAFFTPPPRRSRRRSPPSLSRQLAQGWREGALPPTSAVEGWPGESRRQIRGCAGVGVSTGAALRATPSRFSTEPHCFIGKLVGSTRTRHR